MEIPTERESSFHLRFDFPYSSCLLTDDGAVSLKLSKWEQEIFALPNGKRPLETESYSQIGYCSIRLSTKISGFFGLMVRMLSQPQAIRTGLGVDPGVWIKVNVMADKESWNIINVLSAEIQQGLGTKTGHIKHERHCFVGICKHREGSWKYDVQQSIFDEIRGVWIANGALPRVFDISSQSKHKLRSKQRSKIVKIYAN